MPANINVERITPDGPEVQEVTLPVEVDFSIDETNLDGELCPMDRDWETYRR